MLKVNDQVTVIDVHTSEIIELTFITSAWSRLVINGKDASGKPRQFRGDEAGNGFYYGIGAQTDKKIRLTKDGDAELFIQHKEARFQRNEEAKKIQAEREAEKAKRNAEKAAKRAEMEAAQAIAKAECWAVNQPRWEARTELETENGKLTIFTIVSKEGKPATQMVHFYSETDFNWDWDAEKNTVEERYETVWNACLGNFSDRSIGGSSGFFKAKSIEEVAQNIAFRGWNW